MTEPQLNQMATRLDTVADDVAALKTDVAQLKTDVAGLKVDVARLENRLEELGRYMLVLHEDVIDRLKAADPHEGLRLEMRAGFAEIRQLFSEHLIQDGDAHRYFAGQLKEHSDRLTKLERPH